jgi:GT2 family glycosyltransferase
MDSDDIMLPNRIIKQIEYMNKNPNVMICGAQIHCFKENINNISYSTNHPSITWDEYKEKKIQWFTNHPTLCYRKKAILDVGNYDINKMRNSEDFELILRVLKKFGYIHNFTEVLLYYRLHENQVTHDGGKEGRVYWNEIRNEIINDLINN